jgi:FKBP-type peptidyl-prolyl cis-trans isomerase FkpA/FKBP-type peptidyl-prolyl cis-trans isomerase FklB
MHRVLSASLLSLSIFVVSGCARAKPPTEPELKTDQDKTVYALGLVLGQNLAQFELTPAEIEIVKTAMTDSLLKRPAKADLNTYGPKIPELLASVQKKSSEAYLAKAATEKDAKKTASGLIITTLTEGTGPQPTADSTVKVNYVGKLVDGTEFDSSIKRGEPAVFPLKQVIPCWTEGVAMMKVGGKSRLVCPSDIAYGDRGQPPLIKPGATLVFEVDLLSIEK